jgi:hypothetical protein
MKRAVSSIYYDTSVEPYLHYDSADDLRAYSEACLALEELPLDDLVLLRHFRELSRFVEDLVAAVYEALEARDARLSERVGQSAMALAIMDAEQQELRPQQQSGVEAIDVRAMLGVAWYWHKLVRQRRREMTGLYANALLLSWSAYCKLYHLYVVVSADDAALGDKTGDEFRYCRAVSQAECSAVVSNAPLCHYTISDIWAAVRRIVPSLYQYAYDVEMRIYMHALFFRYCDLFCSAAHDDDDGRALDHPLFACKLSLAEEATERAAAGETTDDEHYDAYRAVTVRLGPHHVLKSEYFYEGELLFFFQLARLRLSEQLHAQQQARPIVLADETVVSAEGLARSAALVLQMLGELAVHPCIKKYVIEEFKRGIMSIYLYHGERERFARRNPTASAEPSDVLSVCRPNDHMTAVAMQKATLRDVLAKPRECAREVMLVAKHATHQWFKYAEVKRHDDIDRCFVIEELCSVEALEQLVTHNELAWQADDDDDDVPVLLKLVNVHYVLHRGGVYRAHDFVDAYMVWLNLLINATLLCANDVHERITDELRYFVPQLS